MSERIDWFLAAALILLTIAVMSILSGCSAALPLVRRDAPEPTLRQAPGAMIWLNAGELAESCRKETPACDAFLAGVDEIYGIASGSRGFCAPPDVGLERLRAEFVAWADAHVELMDAPASTAALEAWHLRWKCDPRGSAMPEPLKSVAR